MYSERRYKKRLHRKRPFILIGNNIDGRIWSQMSYHYKNLAELEQNLYSNLSEIKAEGEWRFDLYQVPKDHKIYFRLGRFKYPDRGTKLLSYSYMNLPILSVQFRKKEISLIGADRDFFNHYEHDVLVEVHRLIWDWK